VGQNDKEFEKIIKMNFKRIIVIPKEERIVVIITKIKGIINFQTCI
jgi:hypothetical protein